MFKLERTMDYMFTLFVIFMIVIICKTVDKLLWAYHYKENRTSWLEQSNTHYWKTVYNFIKDINPEIKANTNIYKPYKRNIMNLVESMSPEDQIKLNGLLYFHAMPWLEER